MRDKTNNAIRISTIILIAILLAIIGFLLRRNGQFARQVERAQESVRTAQAEVADVRTKLAAAEETRQRLSTSLSAAEETNSRLRESAEEFEARANELGRAVASSGELVGDIGTDIERITAIVDATILFLQETGIANSSD